jgi:hypothetical protein
MKNSICTAYNYLLRSKAQMYISYLMTLLNIIAIAFGLYSFLGGEMPNSGDSTTIHDEYFNIPENNGDILTGKLIAQFVLSIESLWILLLPACCVFYFAFSNKLLENTEEKLLFSFKFDDNDIETDHTEIIQTDQILKSEGNISLDSESVNQYKQRDKPGKSEYHKKYIGFQNNHDRFDSVSTSCESPFDDSLLQIAAKNVEEKQCKSLNQEPKGYLIV